MIFKFENYLLVINLFADNIFKICADGFGMVSKILWIYFNFFEEDLFLFWLLIWVNLNELLCWIYFLISNINQGAFSILICFYFETFTYLSNNPWKILRIDTVFSWIKFFSFFCFKFSYSLTVFEVSLFL